MANNGKSSLKNILDLVKPAKTSVIQKIFNKREPYKTVSTSRSLDVDLIKQSFNDAYIKKFEDLKSNVLNESDKQKIDNVISIIKNCRDAIFDGADIKKNFVDNIPQKEYEHFTQIFANISSNLKALNNGDALKEVFDTQIEKISAWAEALQKLTPYYSMVANGSSYKDFETAKNEAEHDEFSENYTQDLKLVKAFEAIGVTLVYTDNKWKQINDTDNKNGIVNQKGETFQFGDYADIENFLTGYLNKPVKDRGGYISPQSIIDLYIEGAKDHFSYSGLDPISKSIYDKKFATYQAYYKNEYPAVGIISSPNGQLFKHNQDVLKAAVVACQRFYMEEYHTSDFDDKFWWGKDTFTTRESVLFDRLGRDDSRARQFYSDNMSKYVQTIKSLFEELTSSVELNPNKENVTKLFGIFTDKETELDKLPNEVRKIIKDSATRISKNPQIDPSARDILDYYANIQIEETSQKKVSDTQAREQGKRTTGLSKKDIESFTGYLYDDDEIENGFHANYQIDSIIHLLEDENSFLHKAYFKDEYVGNPDKFIEYLRENDLLTSENNSEMRLSEEAIRIVLNCVNSESKRVELPENFPETKALNDQLDRATKSAIIVDWAYKQLKSREGLSARYASASESEKKAIVHQLCQEAKSKYDSILQEYKDSKDDKRVARYYSTEYNGYSAESILANIAESTANGEPDFLTPEGKIIESSYESYKKSAQEKFKKAQSEYEAPIDSIETTEAEKEEETKKPKEKELDVDDILKKLKPYNKKTAQKFLKNLLKFVKGLETVKEETTPITPSPVCEDESTESADSLGDKIDETSKPTPEEYIDKQKDCANYVITNIYADALRRHYVNSENFNDNDSPERAKFEALTSIVSANDKDNKCFADQNGKQYSRSEIMREILSSMIQGRKPNIDKIEGDPALKEELKKSVEVLRQVFDEQEKVQEATDIVKPEIESFEEMIKAKFDKLKDKDITPDKYDEIYREVAQSFSTKLNSLIKQKQENINENEGASGGDSLERE